MPPHRDDDKLKKQLKLSARKTGTKRTMTMTMTMTMTLLAASGLENRATVRRRAAAGPRRWRCDCGGNEAHDSTHQIMEVERKQKRTKLILLLLLLLLQCLDGQ